MLSGTLDCNINMPLAPKVLKFNFFCEMPIVSFCEYMYMYVHYVECGTSGTKGISICMSSYVSHSVYTCKWMYNDNSIVFLKMGATKLRRRRSMLHTRIIICIGNTCSTTIQITATLHEVLQRLYTIDAHNLMWEKL